MRKGRATAPSARQSTHALLRGEGRGLRNLGQEDARALDGGLDNWIAANGNEGERALACAPVGGDLGRL
jgi:hypothetical protein